MASVRLRILFVRWGGGGENLCSHHFCLISCIFLNKESWFSSDSQKVVKYVKNHQEQKRCSGGRGCGGGKRGKDRACESLGTEQGQLTIHSLTVRLVHGHTCGSPRCPCCLPNNRLCPDETSNKAHGCLGIASKDKALVNQCILL